MQHEHDYIDYIRLNYIDLDAPIHIDGRNVNIRDCNWLDILNRGTSEFNPTAGDNKAIIVIRHMRNPPTFDNSSSLGSSFWNTDPDDLHLSIDNEYDARQWEFVLYDYGGDRINIIDARYRPFFNPEDTIVWWTAFSHNSLYQLSNPRINIAPNVLNQIIINWQIEIPQNVTYGYVQYIIRRFFQPLLHKISLIFESAYGQSLEQYLASQDMATLS